MSTITDLNFKLVTAWKNRFDNLIKKLNNKDSVDLFDIFTLLSIDFDKLFYEINNLKNTKQLAKLEDNLINDFKNLKFVIDNYMEPMFQNTLNLSKFFQNNNFKNLMTKFLAAIIDLKNSKFVLDNIGHNFISLCNNFFSSAGKYLNQYSIEHENNKIEIEESNILVNNINTVNKNFEELFKFFSQIFFVNLLVFNNADVYHVKIYLYLISLYILLY